MNTHMHSCPCSCVCTWWCGSLNMGKWELLSRRGSLLPGGTGGAYLHVSIFWPLTLSQHSSRVFWDKSLPLASVAPPAGPTEGKGASRDWFLSWPPRLRSSHLSSLHTGHPGSQNLTSAWLHLGWRG